ncbi:MAG: energy transducer TonB [Alphaproteobacteria bacterium]|nr:energy transducer TonB [Alphaproteobacteria bacterium]
MLLLVLLTTLQAAAEPAVTADCRILAAVDGRRITQVAFDCPDDVADAAALQAHADAVAAQFGVPLDTQTLRVGGVSSTARFTLAEEGWRLLEPARFLSSPPSYVPSAAQRGIDARCDMRVELGPDGAPRDVVTVCQPFRRSGQPVRQRGFEAEAQAAVARSRWFAPLGADGACVTYSLEFQIDPGGDAEERPHLQQPVDRAPTCS